MLELEKVQPAPLIALLNVRARLLREREIGARVALPDEIALVTLIKTFEGVIADRDEHPESGLAIDLRLAHEAVLHEAAQRVEDIPAELLRRATDRLDLRKRPASHEDREPREELALDGI